MAILANALLPSLAEMIPTARAGEMPFVEICSAQGLRYEAALPQSGGEQDSDKHSAASHCAFCPVHANPLALLHRKIEVAPAPRATYLAPLFLAASEPQFAWIAPPSRGPPVFG